jgi:hypothetical protein
LSDPETSAALCRSGCYEMDTSGTAAGRRENGSALAGAIVWPQAPATRAAPTTMSALFDCWQERLRDAGCALGLRANCGNNTITSGECERRARARPAGSLRDHTLERGALVQHARRARPGRFSRAVPHLLATDLCFHLQPRLLRHRRARLDTTGSSSSCSRRKALTPSIWIRSSTGSERGRHIRRIHSVR